MPVINRPNKSEIMSIILLERSGWMGKVSGWGILEDEEREIGG